MPPRTRGVVLSPAPGSSNGPTSTSGPSRISAAAASSKPGSLQLGVRGYLMLAVLLEVAAIAGLRHMFRNHHGG